MPQAGFEPVQNLSSGLVEWSCALVQPWESVAAFGNTVVNAILCWFYDGKKNAVVKVFTYAVFPLRFYSVVDNSWKI